MRPAWVLRGKGEKEKKERKRRERERKRAGEDGGGYGGNQGGNQGESVWSPLSPEESQTPAQSRDKKGPFLHPSCSCPHHLPKCLLCPGEIMACQRGTIITNCFSLYANSWLSIAIALFRAYIVSTEESVR